ncbi:MAG: hypothetical protein HXX08_07815 [Chloroflexi bacterium]|uniref:DUF485 domain-containing protein n=1 Tax=Candidatus Chlorohelix allophototropha TaxID=3003348 RepID=A0A8T7M1A7_9CHLR|nr:hypothetical protein [Chloroflexota bacterium]WJW67637.1 hypothetical protein OZ401_000908 [Chloroflexota bacterium L227-S17]
MELFPGRGQRNKSHPEPQSYGAADSGSSSGGFGLSGGKAYLPDLDYELDDVILGYDESLYFNESLPELTNPDSDSKQTLQEVAEQTAYGKVFLNHLIRRQRALSLSVAFTFLAIILGLPLLNIFTREFGTLIIFEFPINWLFLSILIYPLIWVLAYYFVSTADKYEEEFTKLVE